MVSLSEIRRLGERLHATTHVFDPPLGSGSAPSFVVKDLIDVAGWPTGGGNPDWPAYAGTPTRHAAVVERLLAAAVR